MTCQNMSPEWTFLADTVMGGRSEGRIDAVTDGGNLATRLTGRVSLENNGGFIQMASDLGGGGRPFDASGFTGVAFDARGNGESYQVGLRTTDLTRPWQSYRTSFDARKEWQRINLPFDVFEPNRTEAPFNPARLRRIGILAIGREFDADVMIADLCLLR